MKVQVDLAQLKTGVEVLRKLSSKKTYISLVAQKGRGKAQQTLTVVRCDAPDSGSVTHTQFELSCTVKQAGAVRVPLAQLRSLCEVEATSLEIESGEAGTVFTAGATRLELEPDTNPYPPSLAHPVQDGKSLMLPKSMLLNSLQTCLKFARQKSYLAQDVLQAVLWRGDSQGQLEFVSSDGHRVCLHQEQPKQYEGATAKGLENLGHCQMVVPLLINRRLLKLLKACPDEVLCGVNFGWNAVEFTIGSYYLKAPLNTGSYPQVNQILPVKFARQLIVKRTKLLQAVRFLKGFCANSLVLRFNQAENQLTVVGYSDEVAGGEAQQSLWAEIEGGDLEIAFNLQYFKEAIAVYTSEEVILRFNSSKNVAGIFPREVAPKTQCYLMPVKIKPKVVAEKKVEETETSASLDNQTVEVEKTKVA